MDSTTLALLANSNELHTKPANPGISLTLFTSVWTSASPWGTGGLPGTGGRQCTNATTGAMVIPTSTIEGSKLRIVRTRTYASGSAATNVIYDRLVDYSGLDATSTATNNLAAVALPRFTTGAGVFFVLEVFTTGASAVSTTATVSYTNQAGTAGRTATIPLVAGWLTATRIYIPNLQAGDSGVRSVQSVTLANASPNAGNYGITLFAPLVHTSTGRVTSAGAGSSFRDLLQQPCLPFDTTSCLSYFSIANSASPGAPELSYTVL